MIKLPPRNDFDWSEESLSAGAGWGEYVEEYEVSLYPIQGPSSIYRGPFVTHRLHSTHWWSCVIDGVNMWKSRRCLKLCNVCSVLVDLGRVGGIGVAHENTPIGVMVMLVDCRFLCPPRDFVWRTQLANEPLIYAQIDHRYRLTWKMQQIDIC